jgi:hypothetical protein
MALEDIKEIIARVATDNGFRQDFFNPKSIDKVLAPYEGRLTQEEKQCLRELTLEKVEQYVRKEKYSCSDIRI